MLELTSITAAGEAHLTDRQFFELQGHVLTKTISLDASQH